MKYNCKGRNLSFITLLEDNKNATIFRHFKDKEYKIITIGKNTETLEDEVIYKAMYGDKKCWVRKANEFFSKVDKEKYPNVKQVYRFEKHNL